MKTLFCIALLCAQFGVFAQNNPCPKGTQLSNNILKNGDFEKGNVDFQSDYWKAEYSGELYPEGGYAVGNKSTYYHSGFSNCGDHTTGKGNMLIVNGSTTPNQIVWKQTVKVQANTKYTFSLFSQNFGMTNTQLLLRINGKQYDLGNTTTTNCEWLEHKIEWESDNAKDANIEIIDGITDAGGNDFVIDDLNFCGCEPEKPKPSECPLGMKKSKNLIINGDFQQGSQHFQSDYSESLYLKDGLIPANFYAVTSEIGSLHTVLKTCGDHSSTGKGKMLIVNGSPNTKQVIWKQRIKVNPHVVYTFSMFVQNLNYTPDVHLWLRINGQKVDLGEQYGFACAAQNQWSEHKVEWFSNNSKEALIELVDASDVLAGNDFVIDDLNFCGCEPDQPQKNALDSVRINETIVLENVQFQQSKYDLELLGKQELDKVVEWLHNHPSLRIELSGHTSNEGAEDKNLELSRQRVEACKNYILEQGVDKQRVATVAYGETKPAHPNDTPEHRKKNRRVELKILKL